MQRPDELVRPSEGKVRLRDLERLYDYGYWANKKLFGVVSQLTAEQFTQSVAGGYGSIRNTLVHILSAEWGWLERCGGPRRGERLKSDDYPTPESIVSEWQKVEGYVRNFLSGLSDEDLLRDVEFAIDAGEKRSAPLGDLMEHAAIHAVHHRGQVALMLRVLGYAPGSFDFVVYAEEKQHISSS